jgi:hypothetical protein
MHYAHWNEFLLNSGDMEKIAISSKDLFEKVIKPAQRQGRIIFTPKVMKSPDRLITKNQLRYLKGEIRSRKLMNTDMYGAPKSLEEARKIDELKKSTKAFKKEQKMFDSNKNPNSGFARPIITPADVLNKNNSIRQRLGFHNVLKNYYTDKSLSARQALKQMPRGAGKGTAVVQPIEAFPFSRMGIPEEAKQYFNKNKKEYRAFSSLVGAHELDELDGASKKFKPGNKWIRSRFSRASHNSLQGLQDLQRVRSMAPNDAPVAQKAVRQMRFREIDAMIKHAPGLKPVLRGYSSNPRDIEKIVKQTIRENKNFNAVLRARAEGLGQNAQNYIGKRFKPTDYESVYKSVRAAEEVRINRHMKRHIGNTLDNLPQVQHAEKRLKPQLKGILKKKEYKGALKVNPAAPSSYDAPTLPAGLQRSSYDAPTLPGLQYSSHDAPTLPGLQHSSYDAPTLPGV